MIVIENRPSRRTASVPMLYTWLHDQQCFTEFPIFSLRLIVLNGRGPPAGNSVAFFTPFGGLGRAAVQRARVK